jgi:photosystem I reaction center subunit V
MLKALDGIANHVKSSSMLCAALPVWDNQSFLRFTFISMPRSRAEGETCCCRLAQEASFILKSNDPEGFNIIDVMAYGSLGHALGFLLLACSSLGTKPIPF